MGTRESRQQSGGSLREVVVERLAAGGEGVARIDGKAAFVPLSAPGDLLRVEVLTDRGRWCRARIVEILRPSSRRVPPPCPVFGDCGGCRWQHLAYDEQLAQKRAIVEDALRRIGRIGPPSVPEVLPSPRPYGYRHRARLHAARRGGATHFGFYRAGSRDVVPLDGCPVLHPGLGGVFATLAATARRHPALFLGVGEIRADTDWAGSAVRLALRTPRGEPLAVPPEAAAFLRETAPRGTWILAGEDAATPFALGPGADALLTTGEAFTQVNLEANRTLVRIAIEFAAPQPDEETLDLYCGLGNLSLPAAARGARVLGVDLDAEAVRQAEANARRLGLPGATYRSGRAAEEAGALLAARRRFGLVMLNPPRTGARDVVGAVAALGPTRVLVVSCDPATLARDAALFDASGYRLELVQPVDLFPQTPHVETVALFRRRA